MASLRIITHAYAMQLPQYAVFLRTHLSSLEITNPKNVKITVCYTPGDTRVVAVLKDFESTLGDRLQTKPMPIACIGRRSMGRSQVGRKTQEDLIWFADCDYFWGPGCFETLFQTWENLEESKPTLIWPKFVNKQATPEIGDQFVRDWEDWLGTRLIEPNTEDFVESEQTLAIGGIQIVDSRFVREYGYIDHDEKFHKAINIQAGEKMFNTREDSKFRKHIAKKGYDRQKIEIPNVYRLRHTQVSYR